MKIHDILIRFARGARVAVVLAVAGCGGGKDVQVQNQGELCVGGAITFGPPDTTPREFVVGATVDLSVLFPPRCLSSTCMTNPMTSCAVAQIGTGNTFAVTGTASYHETGDNACSADCRLLTASCTTPPLAEGTHTFQYAGRSIDLVVPSTVPPPCTGTPFGS